MELKRQQSPLGPNINSVGDKDENVTVFINLASGFTVKDLQTMDYVEVIDVLPSSILASVPVSHLMSLSKEKSISRVEISKEVDAYMNYARPSGQVNSVLSGFDHNGTTLAFDGSGVVLGMMDVGLEGNHLNFKNDDGSTRIQRLWWMKSNDGTSTLYTPENINTFTTDNTKETHATHVAGIMGGSYEGIGTFSYMPSPSAANPEMRVDQPIPYYGVAPGAILALNVGQLYTPNIVQGVKNVMDYAQEIGKPAVVNLSLGITVGPHDGTDAYTSALSDLGKRGIICISAGNDGDADISIAKNIASTSGSNSFLKTFIRGNAENVIDGEVDLWGTDNTILTVQWGIYSSSTRSFKPFITIDNANQSFSSSGNTDFSDYFTGSLVASSWIDPNNNRFNVVTNFNSVKSKDSNHVIALNVTKAKTGQTIYVYSSSRNLTFSYKPSNSASIVDEYTNGSPSNSINNLACAKNVISVGAYVSRTTYGILKPGYYMPAPSDMTLDGLAPFSSYGTTFDGTKLPMICAPGARIISSFSRYYVNDTNSAENMVARAKNGTETDYWGGLNGTSMSCPFVSGTIALWLQANPDLGYEDVVTVINETSFFNSFTMRPKERWGAGKIDALAGVKYILSNPAANGSVWEDDGKRLVVTYNGAGYDVTMAGEARFAVTLYDMQGRPVATGRGIDGQASVSTAELTPGVYVLAAQGSSARLTRKVTVR